MTKPSLEVSFFVARLSQCLFLPISRAGRWKICQTFRAIRATLNTFSSPAMLDILYDFDTCHWSTDPKALHSAGDG